VALASEDRRRFDTFFVDHPDPAVRELVETGLAGADRDRGAWPLAGRTLLTGEPVAIDGIRPGELDGIVNPAMDPLLARAGVSAVVFLPLRSPTGIRGVIGIARGADAAPFAPEEIEAVRAVADLVWSPEPLGLLPLLVRPGDDGAGLRDAERRFRTLVERVPAVVYEAEPGVAGRWRYVSPYVSTLLGFDPVDWLENPDLWASRVHPDDRERVLEAEARLAGGERVAMEYRLLARDGSVVWVHDDAQPREDPDGIQVLDGLLTDVTDRKAGEARLQYLADHDALTGLLNRRRFLEELELELAVVRRGMRSSAAIVLDVDGFKYVNDSLGHQAGDELIRTVAGLLADRLRASDAVARLGGDEFACLLRGTGAKEAEEVARQLLAALRTHRFDAAEDDAIRVTASAGVTGLGDAEEGSAEAVLSAADLALYEGKRAGRDRVVRFTPRLRADLERGRSWLARLRDALENDGFQLFAQPVMDLRTRGVVQHELLLRLPGEHGDLTGPDAFLPVAERFDLLEAIDRWVLERTLAMLRSPATEGLSFGVNLSSRSIGGGAVTELLERELARGGIDPSRLIVEITETAAIANMQDARTLSEQLSRLGVRMALDDFGSGFGSFYYLKHLPVDYLKIDGEFIRGLTASPVDQEVVKAIVMLARAVGRRTIAEFVPDAATLELLVDFGVDLAQGFHIGHPRPVEDLF
jgi:diguanylate cyclase (GGDEF)-like protein/PAS domain S-box-containing protein